MCKVTVKRHVTNFKNQKSNVQIQWLNDKRLFVQVSTILREFIGMTTISQVTIYFLSGGSKWCRECSDEQSLRKRSRPEVSIKSDTVRQINLVIKCMPVHIAMAASSYPNTGHGGHRFLHARPSGLQIVWWDRPGNLAVRCMVESLLTDQRQKA